MTDIFIQNYYSAEVVYLLNYYCYYLPIYIYLYIYIYIYIYICVCVCVYVCVCK